MFYENEVPDILTTPSTDEPELSAELDLSTHCVHRFRERVRPTLCLEAAKAELIRLLSEFGEVTSTRPGWIRTPGRHQTDGWIVVEDLALPLRKRGCVYIATTTLCAGHSPERSRQRRLRKRKRAMNRGNRGHS
jgi:hypothetical protein